MRDLNNTKEKNEKLVLLYSVYSVIVEMIDAPKTEKEALERYLNSLIKK